VTRDGSYQGGPENQSLKIGASVAPKFAATRETFARIAAYDSAMKQKNLPTKRFPRPVRRILSTLGIVALASGAALGSVGCNDESDSAPQFIEPDWIHDPGTDTGSSTGPTPTPTPSATPTSAPSPNPSGVELYTGPEEMAPYVDKFVADALIQGANVIPLMKNPKLSIRIASLDAYGTSVIGLCETGNGLRRVTFDPDFWNNVSETQKELVAHHEFGHCVLYRGHNSNYLDSGEYASIMYPIIMSTATYRGNYDYYQEELFSTAH
jgi:hypothetical protein